MSVVCDPTKHAWFGNYPLTGLQHCQHCPAKRLRMPPPIPGMTSHIYYRVIEPGCLHPLEKRLRDVYSNSVSSSAREICKQCGTVIFETKEDT